MSRATPLVLGGLWVAALIAVAVMAALDLPGVAQGYYAAWLVAVSLPLGALPLLMVHDLLEVPESSASAALRLILAMLPVLALLLVPVLLDTKAIFPWPDGSTLVIAAPGYEGLGAAWFSNGSFVLRSVIYLLIWVVLSLFFVRPSAPTVKHRRAAILGLMLHLVIGTLAAYDWFMSLDKGYVSSAYGVVVIAAQALFALSVALLATLFVRRETRPARFAIEAVLVVAFLAAFVQFAQFLVVWSSNLPKEIVWYQTRWRGLLGPLFVGAIPVLLCAATILLMPRRFNGSKLLTGLGLGALVTVALLDLLCLASPRDLFTLAYALLDLAFLIGFLGLGAAFAAFVGDRSRFMPGSVARPRP